MQEEIKNLIHDALKTLGIEDGDSRSDEHPFGRVAVEHPEDLKNGDYSTNVAMVCAKSLKTSPRDLAEKIAETLRQAQGKFPGIQEIQVAGAGFINFYLSRDFFVQSVKEVLNSQNFGKNDLLNGQKILVEHTDPNPFKEFHIGHLMPNVVGSTIARIMEWNGAEVKQACYQGDVGMHVAKAVWGLGVAAQLDQTLRTRIEKGLGILTSTDLAAAYTRGSFEYENDESVRKDIIEINKIIYQHRTGDTKSQAIQFWYKIGREISLNYFSLIYKKLGTGFDYFFFESEVADAGKELVLSNVGKIFENGDGGAIVFKAENFDKTLHTRVFVNGEGLPTYEAKELGLAKAKYEKYKYDKSIVVTGNEINDYFKVLLCAMKQIFPELAEKTKHISHGMLRLPTGKMSSRTGDVITAESLIDMVKEKVRGDEAVAIGAIKYMILRQSIGGDIIFDIEKSVSTEGDSGPYLQYSYARANSILEKAKSENIDSDTSNPSTEVTELEKMLYQFREIVARAGEEAEPHHIVTYLTELARSFNSFYGNSVIVKKDDPTSPYKVALTSAFATVMKNGLSLLGIDAPAKM